MRSLSFDVRMRGYDEAQALYDPRKVDRAASAALNKLMTRAKTRASKVIRKDFSIKAADINRKLEVKRSTVSTLQASIRLRGKSIGLINFNARWARGKRVLSRPEYGKLEVSYTKRASSKQGVRVRVAKGRITLISDAWIARGREGLVLGDRTAQVWRRTNRGIVPIRIPSLAILFGREKTQRHIDRVIKYQWGTLFNHELDRVLRRGSFRE